MADVSFCDRSVFENNPKTKNHTAHNTQYKGENNKIYLVSGIYDVSPENCILYE